VRALLIPHNHQFGSPCCRRWARMRLPPAAGSFRSGSAWLGRSQKDGLPSRCRGWHGKLGFKAINLRTGKGSLIAAPFNRDRNGRQENTGPCFARRVVDLLRGLSLGYGPGCFHISLCRARCRRRSRRRSSKAPTLTSANWQTTLRDTSANVCSTRRMKRSANAAITDPIKFVLDFSDIKSRGPAQEASPAPPSTRRTRRARTRHRSAAEIEVAHYVNQLARHS
jgi:hypothetical protein